MIPNWGDRLTGLCKLSSHSKVCLPVSAAARICLLIHAAEDGAAVLKHPNSGAPRESPPGAGKWDGQIALKGTSATNNL